MSWGLLFFIIYLLGILFAACVFARPIRRTMGFDSKPAHADDESAADAHTIIVATVTGVAMLWPLTLSLYFVSRFVLASTMADDDRVSTEIEIFCEEITRAS